MANNIFLVCRLRIFNQKGSIKYSMFLVICVCVCVCLQSCKFLFCKIYNTVNYRSRIIAEAWVFVFPRPLPPLPPGCRGVGVVSSLEA